MKYKAIIETDEYKDFEFFEDADGKYLAAKDKNAKYEEFIALRFTECKQEPVLDKIRAEIERITDTMGVSYNQYVSKIDVLRIIDKYRAESEEEE